MHLYISGPMTGIPAFNFPAFNEAAQQLRAAGHQVTNPADGGADPDKTWADYLRDDIHLLLDCDAVAVLPNWELSRGARLELHIARALGMPIRTAARWANDPDNIGLVRS